MASQSSSNLPTECELTQIFPAVGVRDATLIYATSILNIVIALLGTLANGLVIMAYCCSRRLRTIQNKIFLLLALTDISVTAFVQPMYVAANLTKVLASPSCLLSDARVALSRLFLQLSLETIVILSLQSYIILAYPYRWQSILTKFRFNLAIVASWLLVLFTSFGDYLHSAIFSYIAFCVLSLTIVTVVVVWCWTCKLVARHRRAIQTAQTPSASENISRRKILRSTVTAFLVISSLLACYFLSLCFYIFRIFVNPAKTVYGTYPVLWSVTVSLMYLNSLFNPCLLLWRSTPFRETVKRSLNL